jgi:sensor histidine kinase YesM
MLKDNSFLKDVVIQKKYRWLRHSVLILVLFANLFIWDADVAYLNTVVKPNLSDGQLHDLGLRLYYCSFFTFLVGLAIVYINIYFLVPRLFLRYKYAWYTVCALILSFVFFVAVIQFALVFFGEYKQFIYPIGFTILDFIQQAITPLAFLGATTGVKIFKIWMLDTERFAAIKENELQNELTNLKNQVNPHFLFNTLNNIRTLNEVDVKKANQVLLGLSDILRYQIYDSSKEQIKLSKDIAILDDYLLLEKIRRDNFTYEIVVEGDPSAISMPPLLFINFVENAIKHGADARSNSFCNIGFTIGENNVWFTCVNSKPSVTIKSNGGLGIKNVERRLNLLYPNKHKLEIIDVPNLYTVNLTLPI